MRVFLIGLAENIDFRINPFDDFLVHIIRKTLEEMKNPDIIAIRRNLNLSQAELAEKAGLSIRTVQRIESGATPKGYTLEALCTALESTREELRGSSEQQKVNWRMVKYLNLSSLPLMIIPTANILIPLVLIYWKREINHATKQIVSIQILWTIISLIVIILMAIIREWLDIAPQIMALTLMLLIIANFYIIIRNTRAIDKNQSLTIKPSFTFF